MQSRRQRETEATKACEDVNYVGMHAAPKEKPPHERLPSLPRGRVRYAGVIFEAREKVPIACL